MSELIDAMRQPHSTSFTTIKPRQAGESIVIERYRYGITRTIFTWGGDIWTVYLFVPKRTLKRLSRLIRRLENRRPEIWDLLPDLLSSAGYGGPGMAFANPPVYRCRRNGVTVFQRGGYDV